MSEPAAPRRAAAAELIIPLTAVAFTLYYVWSVREGPWEAQFSAVFVGTSLLLACAIFIGNRIWRWLREDWSHLPSTDAMPRGVTVTRAVLLVLTLGYALMIDNGVGFTLSSFIFLACAIALLTRLANPVAALAVATTLSLTGYLLFVVAFETRFPEGPVERLLAGLFA